MRPGPGRGRRFGNNRDITCQLVGVGRQYDQAFVSGTTLEPKQSCDGTSVHGIATQTEAILGGVRDDSALSNDIRRSLDGPAHQRSDLRQSLLSLIVFHETKTEAGALVRVID